MCLMCLFFCLFVSAGSDAHPMIPSKHQVERCLPMTTTHLCCQMDCCINTQQTAIHSQKQCPYFQRSTNTPPLHFLRTKVKILDWIIYNYTPYIIHNVLCMKVLFLSLFFFYLTGCYNYPTQAKKKANKVFEMCICNTLPSCWSYAVK